MRVVFFDIDGTLFNGASSEKQFFSFLFKKGVIGPKQVFAYLYFLVRYFPIYKKNLLKKNKAYLYKLKQNDIEKYAEDFVENILMRQINQYSFKPLVKHLIAGDHVILLSGTLDVIASAICKQLKVEKHIATDCKMDSRNRYTLLPPILHPLGKDKLIIAKQYCDKNDFSLSDAFAYGDSVDDRHLLAAVKYPVIVNPDKNLEKIAHNNNWYSVSEYTSIANLI